MEQSIIKFINPSADVADSARGNLTSYEALVLPFEVKRFFWIRNVPHNVVRGGHYHEVSHQLLVIMAGKVEIEVTDVETRASVKINLEANGEKWNSPAIYIPPGRAIKMRDFSQDCVLLVLASDDYYDPKDCIPFD